MKAPQIYAWVVIRHDADDAHDIFFGIDNT